MGEIVRRIGNLHTTVILFFVLAGMVIGSCAKDDGVNSEAGGLSLNQEEGDALESSFTRFLENTIQAAELPPEIAQNVRDAAAAGPAFILEILPCLNGDPFLHYLVDKTHPLPEGYAPPDLVSLAGAAGGDSYRVSRGGLMLRAAAEESLEEMAAAARREGVNLTIGSAYRSYDYQVEVYGRIVRELGVEEADRESARPGLSQHQTGLVIDFDPINNGFAETPAGKWILENAETFGWSLSFPDGFESITGYRWESWHYRYLGRDISAFAKTYFNGVQQHALRFLHEWEQAML
jgi:D-alanyl-D-alanine carboxypeptidase